MRRSVLSPFTLVLTAGLMTACTEDVDDPPSDGDAVCPAELAVPLQAWGRAGFSGTIVLTDPDGPTCELALGLADQETGRATTLDTTYAIGSVSKAMTAAAVLDLVASGELALDDRAGDHVDGLSGPAADATVKDLLLHTSGLTGTTAGDHEPLDRDDAVVALSGFARTSDAGTEYSYSNEGYTLLALVVEGVTGEPYRQHLVDAVLTVGGGDRALGGFWAGEPAAPGPRAVGADAEAPAPPLGDDDHWALAGNGDVAMTARELAQWTRGLFTGAVIAPEAVDLLEATTIDQGDGVIEVPGWGRFDEERFGEPVYGSAGGGGDLGQDVVTAWLPDSERVITIASNSAGVTAEDLLVEIAPALVAGDPLPEPELATAVDPDALAAVVGTYRLADDGTLEVAATDDGLSIAAVGPTAVDVLFPPADDDDAEARRAHEDRVRAMLAGETEAGRDELAALAEDLGEVSGVTVVGTVVADREVRTYVTLTTEQRSDPVLVWYAVDEAGAIQAVEITDEAPSRALVTDGTDRYRSSDGPEITVAVTGTELVVTGPGGATTTATRT